MNGITKNFTLGELTKTKTGQENIPNVQQRINLIALAKNVLQPLRDLYKNPITINSAFRNPTVNKSVGGAPTSQHMKGEAADITAGNKEENKKLFELIRDNLQFDQLINEKDYSWIHVSYKITGNRKQILKL
jgi:zinc D-Ala-D-Ala carboxypeptidase